MIRGTWNTSYKILPALMLVSHWLVLLILGLQNIIKLSFYQNEIIYSALFVQYKAY